MIALTAQKFGLEDLRELTIQDEAPDVAGYIARRAAELGIDDDTLLLACGNEGLGGHFLLDNLLVHPEFGDDRRDRDAESWLIHRWEYLRGHIREEVRR